MPTFDGLNELQYSSGKVFKRSSIKIGEIKHFR